MDIVVQKFGGSSVTSMERIAQVAQRALSCRGPKEGLVIVISALSGETDRLLALTKQIHPAPSRREVDALLATGEQAAAALLALALDSQGSPAVSFTGAQVPIQTDERFGKAHIRTIPPQNILAELQKGRVVVVAGFQGATENGEVTTLGRGGSDLTAVALAAALGANRCELYKDVAGVFTADPRICSDARLVRRISYDEMLELANLGAKVLQARSVLLAKRYLVPVHVLSTFEEGPGTWVKEEDTEMEGAVITAITCDRKESKISVRHLPAGGGASAKLFAELSDADILVDVIVQDVGADSRTNVTFTVPREDFDNALKIARAADGDVEVFSHDRIAKVSAVGLGMKSRSGVAAKVFEALAKEGIELLAVSTSEIKISCVIEDRYAELAVRALHDAFELAKEPN